VRSSVSDYEHSWILDNEDCPLKRTAEHEDHRGRLRIMAQFFNSRGFSLHLTRGLTARALIEKVTGWAVPVPGG